MYLEIITFTLKDKDQEAALMTASEQMDQFCKEQEGFAYRSLSHNPEDNLWYDVIYWETKAAWEKAETAFQQHPVCEAFMQAVNSESVAMQRSDVKASLSSCEQAA